MKKAALTLGIVLVALVLISAFAMSFITDFIRAQNNQEPIFAIETDFYSDGGTREYLGLGYKVIAYATIPMGDKDDIICEIGIWFLEYDNNYPRYKVVTPEGYEFVTREEYRKEVN